MIFSFGAGNCVVDQTLSTNKTDDDDEEVSFMCGVDCLCPLCTYAQLCMCVPFRQFQHIAINCNSRKNSPSSLHVLTRTVFSVCSAKTVSSSKTKLEMLLSCWSFCPTTVMSLSAHSFSSGDICKLQFNVSINRGNQTTYHHIRLMLKIMLSSKRSK